MQKHRQALCLSIVAFASMLQSAAANCDGQYYTDPQSLEYIVRFASPSLNAQSAERRNETLATRAYLAGAAMDGARQMASGATVLRLRGRDHGFIRTAAARMSKSADVEYIVENTIFQALYAPNDPSYASEQWNMKDTAMGISASNAWGRGQTGVGSVVAVIDSGIVPHDDLNANVVGGYDFITSPELARDGDGRDANPKDEGSFIAGCALYRSIWHGTHVAGIVAAVGNNEKGVIGTAPDAKVVPVRVLGVGGDGSLSDIADAIIWSAGGNVPGVTANPNPADVINLSLGRRQACGPVERDAINFARSMGVVVVAAAGNGTEAASLMTPASCPGVIAVGATDSTGAKANYSNYGPTVALMAPGSDIYSTYDSNLMVPGTPSYKDKSGTSMAAPHVAGAVALMKAVADNRTPDQIKQILQNTSKPLTAACPQGCGSGILDAGRATAAVLTTPWATFNPTTTTGCPSSLFYYQMNNTSSDPNGGALQYHWDFGDGTTASVASPTLKVPEGGQRDITLTVTDPQGNMARSATHVWAPTCL